MRRARRVVEVRAVAVMMWRDWLRREFEPVEDLFDYCGAA
jgi:hypothetical protein